MNTVLSDIIKHLLPDRAFEEFYPNLLTIMAKILDHVHNYALLFSLVGKECYAWLSQCILQVICFIE